MARTNDRIKYKYGICLNDECEKCKSKEVQQIPMRKDLVCETCGKELRECPPPKKSSKTPLIAGGAAVVLAAIIGIGYVASSDNSSKKEPATITATADSTIVADSAKVESVEKDSPAEETAPVQTAEASPKQQPASVEQPSKQKPSTTTASSPSSGTLRLSYGKYTGSIKNGYPHGQGKLTYTTSRQINRNDVKGRTADAGDYVIGEFYNGFVVYGKHYDSAGNLIGSLNFGVGSESSYESK